MYSYGNAVSEILYLLVGDIATALDNSTGIRNTPAPFPHNISLAERSISSATRSHESRAKPVKPKHLLPGAPSSRHQHSAAAPDSTVGVRHRRTQSVLAERFLQPTRNGLLFFAETEAPSLSGVRLAKGIDRPSPAPAICGASEQGAR